MSRTILQLCALYAVVTLLIPSAALADDTYLTIELGSGYVNAQTDNDSTGAMLYVNGIQYAWLDTDFYPYYPSTYDGNLAIDVEVDGVGWNVYNFLENDAEPSNGDGIIDRATPGMYCPISFQKHLGHGHHTIKVTIYAFLEAAGVYDASDSQTLLDVSFDVP